MKTYKELKKEMINDNLLSSDKAYKGAVNELLVSGTLSEYGYTTLVKNDHDPSSDIRLSKNGQILNLECKLDTLSQNTGNFYFEEYNYTYDRYTGIGINDDSLFSYTYKYGNEWYFMIARRKTFKKLILDIAKEDKSKVRRYDNTFEKIDRYKNGKIKCKRTVGDTALIVNRDIFIDRFRNTDKCYIKEIKPCMRWF